MDRDFESKKHGYSAKSYIEVLDSEVAPFFEELDSGYQFMQDNASIHTARTVRDWFRKKNIELVQEWPPYSPDLNPIEHIWWHLKARLYEMFPEISTSKSDSEEARTLMENALKVAWESLDDSLFQELGASMSRRVEAVIAADGWHTKY